MKDLCWCLRAQIKKFGKSQSITRVVAKDNHFELLQHRSNVYLFPEGKQPEETVDCLEERYKSRECVVRDLLGCTKGGAGLIGGEGCCCGDDDSTESNPEPVEELIAQHPLWDKPEFCPLGNPHKFEYVPLF
mmetsp:Transcript_462/g.1763  ORF Transcript_462/g.1763 Transcript_462/m.1763 type:complete len:132 (-) Transcript_462:9-404(-)